MLHIIVHLPIDILGRPDPDPFFIISMGSALGSREKEMVQSNIVISDFRCLPRINVIYHVLIQYH